MTDFDKDKGFNPKFEEYKLYLQRWYFLVNSYWNRFNVFIVIVVIGTSLLTVIMTYILTSTDINKGVWLVLMIVSFGLSGIGVIWYLMLYRVNQDIIMNKKKAKNLQKVLDINFITDDPKPFHLAKIRLKFFSDIVLWAAIIGFLFVSIISFFQL